MFKWLIALAKTNPHIFSIALLLIAVASMAKVIINRDNKIDKCMNEKAALQVYCNTRFDSIDAKHSSTIRQLTNEIKENLQSTITDYKRQLEIQRTVNKIVDSTLNSNRTTLNKNRLKIKTLDTND